MQLQTKISIHWFRRDLRLEDNTSLSYALKNHENVMAIFIFNTQIISQLSHDDPRISFIHHQLISIDQKLKEIGSSIKILSGNPLSVWKKLIKNFQIDSVYCNHDYEPYAIKRDHEIKNLLNSHQIQFYSFKDQVIFEKNEILKSDQTPYTVFTPYKKKWLSKYLNHKININKSIHWENFLKFKIPFPDLEKPGHQKSNQTIVSYSLDNISQYDQYRDYPALDRTTRLGPYLRFGVISIRSMIQNFFTINEVFISELIWREFFMQILYHFPGVKDHNFKSKYDSIHWSNNVKDFEKWCKGETGYPFVDAGMRQLNQTGYMHNRVRMIVAGFLCKHLLIDWRWGEKYFAEKLLDYELSSNNGNWQWAAGTGCDAAPYFRIFNPMTQQKKFDPDLQYIKKWVPEFGTKNYPQPMIEHIFARERALNVYQNKL